MLVKINYKRIGRQIAARRKELGYRQSFVEEKADLSYKYLSNIETGRSIPSLETLVRLCEALDVTPDYFLLGAVHQSDAKSEDQVFREFQLLSHREQELVLSFISWLKGQDL